MATTGIYSNHKFPEWEFREYPKRVYPKDGPKDGFLVNDEREEEQVSGGVAPVSEEEERTKLIAIAELEGVKVDKRWGGERLQKALDDHRAAKGAKE